MKKKDAKDLKIETFEETQSFTTTTSYTPTSNIKPFKFGRYTIISKIAHGGMASLYLAKLEGAFGFEKFLAIKKIHPHLAEHEQFIRMFLDEAKIAALISHPNVVQIFELGEVDGDFFFAMEYLAGEPLVNIIKKLIELKLPPPYQLMSYIIARVAAGLHAAHELKDSEGKPIGVVHRDVSPQNIIVTYDGIVKVVDFGIAKARGRLGHTLTGELKGKLSYMSPEQIKGKDIDRRSDIFSLGIVLWEATTLKRLFKAESELITLEKITKGEIIDPKTIRPDYPEELRNIVLKALKLNPYERFQTAKEMEENLDQFIVNYTTTPPTSGTLSQFMHKLFADEIKQKEELLEYAKSVKVKEEKKRSPLYIAILAGTLSLIITFTITFSLLWLKSSPYSKTPLGILNIESSPNGAYIYIDNKKLPSKSPLKNIKLKLGTHTITLYLEGYEKVERKISLNKPGEVVSLDILLNKKQIESPKGSIYIKSNRALSKVIIDGELIKNIDGEIKLDSGKHEILCYDSEGNSSLKIVKVEPNERKELFLEFNEKIIEKNLTPQIHGYGSLTLYTIPWAIAKIGKKTLGQTPLADYKLKVGKHKIALYPKGDSPPIFIEIEIKKNQETRQKINLEQK